jgi:hypothetical protein
MVILNEDLNSSFSSQDVFDWKRNKSPVTVSPESSSSIAILIEDSDFSVSSHEEDPIDLMIEESDSDSDSSLSCLEEEAIGQQANPALHACETSSPSQGVSFNSMALCYDVMGLDEYSPEEKRASWFTGEDILKMKDIARAEAMLLDHGLLVEWRIRGLEQRTVEGVKQKRHIRLGAYAAVFCEIDFQEEEEILDDASIAKAYKAYSTPAHIAARQMGIKDAQEAENIYKKMTRRRVWLRKTTEKCRESICKRRASISKTKGDKLMSSAPSLRKTKMNKLTSSAA